MTPYSLEIELPPRQVKVDRRQGQAEESLVSTALTAARPGRGGTAWQEADGLGEGAVSELWRRGRRGLLPELFLELFEVLWHALRLLG